MAGEWEAARAPLVRDDRGARRRRRAGHARALPAVPDARRRLADHARAPEGYVDKALREAKRNTNWVDQDHDWEDRVKRFAVALLTYEPFLEDFLPFVELIAAAGERSALGQLLLKLTIPGVPDVYQGDELIDLSLVDPDNRRPVDWDDAPRRARRAARGRRAGARDDEAARHLARAGAARGAAGGRSRARTSRSRRARTSSRSRAARAARCSSSSRCARPAATPSSTFPPAS